MLWQRVLTALVLVPLVVGGILLLDNDVFAAILGLVMLVGAYEFANLSQVSSPLGKGVFVALVALSLFLAMTYLEDLQVEALQWGMSLWWLLISLMLFARGRELQRVEGLRPAILALGALVLLTAWVSIVWLHAGGGQGPAMVLYLFVLIWVADSGAYFAGRTFGRHKLSPFVSPGKTWEGVGGAVLGAVVAAAAVVLSGWVAGIPAVSMVILSVFVTLISIGGDLWESRLKREAGVKDSGTLLPGHGGVLDRIDSLLAAAPVFALGIVILGGRP